MGEQEGVRIVDRTVLELSSQMNRAQARANDDAGRIWADSVEIITPAMIAAMKKTLLGRQVVPADVVDAYGGVIAWMAWTLAITMTSGSDKRRSMALAEATLKTAAGMLPDLARKSSATFVEIQK